MSELEDLELAYIGGLLRLDVQFDAIARDQVFSQLQNKRGPSPSRKG